MFDIALAVFGGAMVVALFGSLLYVVHAHRQLIETVEELNKVPTATVYTATSTDITECPHCGRQILPRERHTQGDSDVGRSQERRDG